MQGKSGRSVKKLAAGPKYISPLQLSLEGFETPFERNLNRENRWVKLAGAIPWDKIVPYYNRVFSSNEGRPPISGRVIIGAMIIKHIENLTDRDTIQHITENIYMQYFLGYSSFTDEAPFTAPLFVAIRKRMTLELTNKISDLIAMYGIQQGEEQAPIVSKDDSDSDSSSSTFILENAGASEHTTDTAVNSEPAPKGKLLMDATVAPQHITFPTDLKLLNAARKKSEELIDRLYNPALHGSTKPRTYRNNARKLFLNTSKKKSKSYRQIHKANGQQLRFLKRNLKHIKVLLAAFDDFPLSPREQKYLLVLHTVYEQQNHLFTNRSKSVPHRIVNIHQPHVRPIVRGKDSAKAEFGSKLQVSLVDGYTFIDKLDWEAYNEGAWLQYSTEKYKQRFGYYPKEVLADKIYCNRANRQWLKEKGIKLSAKPLGRPSAVADHIRPGDRNPIEGKFGQAKLAYGLNCIKAKLKETSESWIACIALVLNLVNLTRQAFLSLIGCMTIIFQPKKVGHQNFKILMPYRVI
jgi:IS5 family transposase